MDEHRAEKGAADRGAAGTGTGTGPAVTKGQEVAVPAATAAPAGSAPAGGKPTGRSTAADGTAVDPDGGAPPAEGGNPAATPRTGTVRPWATDRVIAAAVGGEDREPTLKDLLRHHAGLTQEVGRVQRAVGELAAERDALRRRVAKLDRARATDADAADGPVDVGGVAAGAPAPPTAAHGSEVVGDLGTASIPATAGGRWRWTLLAVALGILALLVVGWWAFGLPWDGGGPIEATPGA